MDGRAVARAAAAARCNGSLTPDRAGGGGGSVRRCVGDDAANSTAAPERRTRCCRRRRQEALLPLRPDAGAFRCTGLPWAQPSRKDGAVQSKPQTARAGVDADGAGGWNGRGRDGVEMGLESGTDTDQTGGSRIPGR